MYTLISSANKYTWTFSFPNYILLISFICFIALANTILNRYREKGIALSCSWLFWVSSHLGWCWLRTCCQLLLWCSGVFLYAWSLQDFYYEVVLDFVKGLFCSQGDNHAFFLSVYAHPPPWIPLLTFIYWPIHAFTGWSLLYYGEFSFWCFWIQFANILLSIFFICVHERNWSVILSLLGLYMVWVSG